ncbi:MAG: hypothetical protein COT24_00675 [Candidatus Kerfeldbacteria bacterium CG08_land_8_20_14_0_20_40_16]|uniref:Type II secretion system protein GspG C-terminal domain-containing protein n=1 Tax=Candidatus Kerfeldbacteria bacterium CG08_land_8_20_14_0_20_40_16 TaxID=2014244 RepID=A0A2H0YZ04_9BACT|nr:MAG: hypothetical protein COT24_00675 [Candidatus Kerfeldbacteria bacterium CG08_land_8_20_14_0_20_40_16]
MSLLRNKKGFTLIELLVVIAIVGLLATIAIVAMNSARQASRDTKRIADIKQIASALEIYFNDFDAYPKNGQVAGGYNEYDETSPTPLYGYSWDSSCGGGSSSDAFLTPLSISGIMRITPDDPNSNNANTCYLYTSTHDGTDYIDGYYLMAYLEGQDGEQICGLGGIETEYICLKNL